MDPDGLDYTVPLSHSMKRPLRFETGCRAGKRIFAFIPNSPQVSLNARRCCVPMDVQRGHWRTSIHLVPIQTAERVSATFRRNGSRGPPTCSDPQGWYVSHRLRSLVQYL